MLAKLRRRWKILPTWIKVVSVLVLLAIISAGHLYIGQFRPDLTPLVKRLYFLPLFMASLLFGLKGGLACAAVVSLNFLPELFPRTPRPSLYLGAWLEIGLYFLTGAITGMLVNRERRETRRLQRAEHLALVGQAAAAVAHEIKNPLVAIGGFAQRLYRDMDPDHPHRREVAIIVEQAGHMESLLREMLDYTRPLELNLEPQEVHHLVEDVVMLASVQARDHGVRLASQVPGEEITLLADGRRLKQVLLNLVKNAVQASSSGGEVTISAWTEGGETVLEVSDRGCGIASEDLERIYFPFYTTKRQGTGLGLAISLKNIQAHGGSLEVDSAPDRGSTFRVRLPNRGPKPKKRANASAA